jgi:hypothetical protein
MGYDLSNAKRETLCLHIEDFPELYQLARNFGWQPMGTILSDGMAQMSAESTQQPRPPWHYTFIIKCENHLFGVERCGLNLSSERKLMKQEIDEKLNNPSEHWSENQLEGFAIPMVCFEIIEKRIPPTLVKTPEDIKNEWEGWYLSNDWQVMVKEDCDNFVQALQRAKAQNAGDPNINEEAIRLISNGPVTIS